MPTTGVRDGTTDNTTAGLRDEPTAWGQFPQQLHGGVHPGAALVGVPDMPGHGDGVRLRRTVEHADDDGGGLIAFERGVDGQGQPA